MTALWIKLGGALAALAAAAGLYAWITTAAYNRGYTKGEADTNARMARVIAEQRKTATQNADKWRNLPPTEKINELKRRCVAACEQEKRCMEACQ